MTSEEGFFALSRRWGSLSGSSSSPFAPIRRSALSSVVDKVDNWSKTDRCLGVLSFILQPNPVERPLFLGVMMSDVGLYRKWFGALSSTTSRSSRSGTPAFSVGSAIVLYRHRARIEFFFALAFGEVS